MLAAVGQPVPDTPHAVSVSLPSWKATVGYEEGEDWVVSKMQTGYPRFFIHLIIQELEKEVIKLYGHAEEHVMLFPSHATAKRCQMFLYDTVESIDRSTVRLLHLEPRVNKNLNPGTVVSGLSCVFFPKELFPVAKQVWQHSGDGISSRRGEFCLKALHEGWLVPASSPVKTRAQDLYHKGPRRYQRVSLNGIEHSSNDLLDSTTNGDKDEATALREYDQFVEERFGRNLNTKLADKAKLAVKRRISGIMVDDIELEHQPTPPSSPSSPSELDSRLSGLSENDVYLYPCGMSAIFNSHRILLANAESHGRPQLKSICFGFPYIDTLKILQKWGPGCLFYGNGSSADLDDLAQRLEAGERYVGMFTEFPSNPLLNSPDLLRIRQLADKYDFAVVVDETVGNFININVLAHADVVVSSLTKIFSGDCNVMGGATVLNPHSKWYHELKRIMEYEYEDNHWAEDSIFLERNSRDFVSRIDRVNITTEALAATLQKCTFVKQVYYPQLSPTKANYDACRNSNGGYGGLLSVTFQRTEQAIAFFDSLEVQKGPSLGTNFTLSCPYTLLAHYSELAWVAEMGVDPDLVRISVGLEESEEMVQKVERALQVAARV